VDLTDTVGEKLDEDKQASDLKHSKQTKQRNQWH
jgi:hypothetical protein